MSVGPLKSNVRALRLRLARLLPAPVREHLRELRTLSSDERRVHLGETLRRLVRRDPLLPSGTDASASILFVCYGNIIRSALAEALFRRHSAAVAAGGVRVRSAGLAAKPGREADARAVAAGRAMGVDLEAHRAQPLTQQLVDDADVIYVMDRLNEAQLLTRFPTARPKLRRLGSLARAGRSDVIADPYVLDAAAVAEAAARIDRATAGLVALLAASRARTPARHPGFDASMRT